MLCIAYVLQRHIKCFSLASHHMQSEECHHCTGPLGCCVAGKGGQDPYRLHYGRVDRTLRGKTGKALLVIPVKKKKKETKNCLLRFSHTDMEKRVFPKKQLHSRLQRLYWFTPVKTVDLRHNCNWGYYLIKFTIIHRRYLRFIRLLPRTDKQVKWGYDGRHYIASFES